MSPHRWGDDVDAAAARLGVTEHVTTATTDDLVVGGERDPRTLAATLWPLDRLARRYQRFIDRYRSIPDDLEAMRRKKQRLAETGLLPALKSQLGNVPDTEAAQAQAKAAENSRFVPSSENWAAVEAAFVLQDMLTEIASGGDIAGAAATADAAIEETLNG